MVHAPLGGNKPPFIVLGMPVGIGINRAIPSPKLPEQWRRHKKTAGFGGRLEKAEKPHRGKLS